MRIEYHSETEIPERKIKFVTLLTSHRDKIVQVKHKKRETWEFPGGHKEAGEDCKTAAERELYEETGASEFTMRCLGVFNVIVDEADSFGKLYAVTITKFDKLPDYEIERVELFERLPDNLTYPEIQKQLFKRYYNK